MDIIKNSDIVKRVMRERKRARNDDNFLTIHVWQYQLCQMNYEGSRDFSDILQLDGLAKPEAITRARRKIQEEHEYLRGDVYKGRQGQQSNVVSQIKNWESKNER